MTQRYDTYKDSGVQWLGEIPGHWEMRKMKYIFDERSEKNHPNEPMLSATQSEGVILQSKYQGRVVVVNTGFEGLKLVKDGDFVIHLRSFQGGIEYAYDRGIISAAYTILNPKYPEFSAYYKRLFKSSSFIDLLKICVTGIREGQNINYSKLKQFFIPLPPLSEQRSIVSFLDAKCGKIDEWVTKKQKEVEHLQELKQRVIADAVTRGLNPHVKMKATNIPWLKEIPEHWEVKPIRAILRENTDKTETGDEELLSLSQYTGISRKKDAAKIGMFEAESTVGYKKVHPGQFVMNIMLAWNGSYAVSEFEGIISPAYCVFDFISKDEKMYYNYLWRLSMYQGAFKTESRGIIDSRLRLYPNKFLPFPTICPPIEEQKQIVSYLDAKCSKIDKLIANIAKEIERIKEYKQRLISDVVTGQIKVC